METRASWRGWRVERCGPLAKRFLAALYRNAQSVIALSDEWKRAIEEVIPDARVVVVPNPIEMPARAAPLDGPPTVLYLGVVKEAKGVYDTLAKSSSALATGLASLAREQGVPFTTASVGGMFGFFFHAGPVESFAQAQQSDAARFRSFFASMLESGVYLAPSPYEAAFVSLAHRPRDIDQTLEAARKALKRCARSR